MSVEICLPPDLYPVHGCQFKPVRAGIVNASKFGGSATSHPIEERARLSVNWPIVEFGTDDDKIEQWHAFLHDCALGARPFWVRPGTASELVHVWRNLLCGPVGDGSRTTFPAPVYMPTTIYGFVAGVPTASTLHTYAQLLESDDACNATTSTTPFAEVSGGGWSGCTISRIDYMARLGRTCLNVVPDDGSNPTGVYHASGYRPAVVVGNDYTAVMSGFSDAAVNLYVGISWFDSGGTLLSTDWSSADATSGAWRDLTVTATAVASAATAAVTAKQAASTAAYYLGCFGLCPGDLDRYYLRSMSPAALEFASAPSNLARVTGTAEGGIRMARIMDPRVSLGAYEMRAPVQYERAFVSGEEFAEVTW